jgi:peptidyl-dipeptidase Dcp
MNRLHEMLHPTRPSQRKARQLVLRASCAALPLLLAACTAHAPPPKLQPQTIAMSEKSAAVQTLPLLEPWTGAYGGVPGFAGVKVSDFEPALEQAMSQTRQELEAIAHNPAAADFANTCAALENAGRGMQRVRRLYHVWQSSLSSPEFQALDRQMAPKLAAFGDELVQNEALFARIQQVYEGLETAKLSAEQKRLVWHQYMDLVKSGAKLSAKDKQALADINQGLARLYTTFSQNVLHDEETFTVLGSAAELDGLPESLRSNARAAAEQRGLHEQWVVANTRSSVETFLTFSARRDLRETVWRKFVNRGDNGDANDNNATVSAILKLRAERAKLQGFATYAHWSLQDSMAKTPEAALDLLQQVWKPALLRVREEVADMQAIANKEPKPVTIAPWDYRYYAEKVRKAKYDLDENEIKPYLQLDKLREALFWVSGELFGFEFVPVTGLPVFHPDVTVWEVRDRQSKQHVGLWYFDPYARPGKNSGAWMASYRNQEDFNGEVTPIVSNNSNFSKPAPGDPTLLSWDDAITMFHEFGHALHGLSSKVSYPSLSGTDVARDFVEFPSQLLEHWLATPEVLNRFAVHYQTGKPMPQATLDKIKRARGFNEGFKTVEYLATALIDMKLHLAGDRPIDPDAFERETLLQMQMPEQIVMRHRTPQLNHVFADDGYAAGYYSYLWADTLTADAFEAFVEAGGPYDHAVAARLAKFVFQVGNTVDPAAAYRSFRGRDPGIGALMRKRGFPVPPSAATH